MHSADKSELELENEKILEKFNFLIEKYHQPDSVVNEVHGLIDIDNIPVLTETVRLRSRNVQPEFGELSPLRLLLDAALHDAHIDLNYADRQALVQALENRIVVQEKDIS
ncbi:MAG: hypothetical protein KIT26_10715 [Nitrosomonas sp.]|nr:hypothetical protein [Nitrosomonas sp.]